MNNFQKQFLNIFTKIIAVGFSLWQLYTLSFGRIDPVLSRRLFVVWLLLLIYLLELNKPQKKYYTANLVFNYVGIISSILIGWYCFANFERLATRWAMVSPVTNADILVGIVLILLIFIGVKRYAGWPLVGIGLGFICYGFIGKFLGFKYFPLAKIIDQLTLTFYGIYSTPIGVASTIVFSFVLFGTFLRNAGGGEFFVSLANRLLGKSRGGPAKVAVFGSLLMGSISGSASANVVTTGTVTIPLMKKIGLPAEFAGAVEAVASTGGAIMPPVMGSAAFIMSELTGISYITIVGAALIPAILFYIALFISIDLKSAKLGIKGSNIIEKIPAMELIIGCVVFLTPLVIIFILLIKGFSPARTGVIATAILIILSWISNKTRLTPIKILKSLEETSKGMLMVMLACGAAGIVLGMISITGIASHLIGTMMVTFHSSVMPLLIITMIINIILGMGMPNSATYILVAALMAPALINLGIPVLIAHLFIIFFSSMSHITPPVMVAGYVASALAEAEPMKLGLNNLRLAFIAFIVPYFMVYEPALIGHDHFLLVILAFLSSCVGIYFIVTSFEGWFVHNQPTLYRIIWMISGLLLLYPGYLTDIIGLFMGSMLILIVLRKARTIDSVRLN